MKTNTKFIATVTLIVAFTFTQCQSAEYDYEESFDAKSLETAQQCCKDTKELRRDCDHALKCQHGSFILDPQLEASDNFHLLSDGSLVAGDTETPRDEFCIGLLSNGTAMRTVAQVCFPDYEETRSQFTLKGIMSLTSMVFLAITVYVYTLIEMRDTQDKVVKVALICLLSFYLGLGSIQLFPEIFGIPVLCTSIAIFVHFFGIGYFTWINMVMANVWKSVVVPRWTVDERKWYLWNHIYAWSVPILIEIVLLIGHFTSHDLLDPKIGHKSCWFGSDTMSMWYMYVPISTMILINLFLFIWTCFVLHRHGADLNPDKKNSLRYRVGMYTKLFLLVGLTWIFEVLSFAVKHDVTLFWLIFDMINASHGFMLFLILVVFRARIKRELAGKRICCCLHAPQHWRDQKDIEHQRLDENDDEVSEEFVSDLVIKG